MRGRKEIPLLLIGHTPNIGNVRNRGLPHLQAAMQNVVAQATARKATCFSHRNPHRQQKEITLTSYSDRLLEISRVAVHAND
jgi:hypothetical protein